MKRVYGVWVDAIDIEEERFVLHGSDAKSGVRFRLAGLFSIPHPELTTMLRGNRPAVLVYEGDTLVAIRG